MRLPPAIPLLITLALAAQGAAPAAHAGGLPVCNAKHKRPANLYGSVLSAGLTPALAHGAAPEAKSAPVPAVAPNATAKPQQVSQADLRAAFAPCGKAHA